MMWIGLTGGIATGKSTVARLLKGLGYPVIDADAIAHTALVQGSPVFGQLVNLFGNEVISGAAIDRAKLARVVFQDKEKLNQLEKIVHPYVQEQVKRQRQGLSDKKYAWAFYDVPLLFEKKLEDQFDAVIVVAAAKETQISRLQRRSHLGDQEIQDRLKNQIPIEEKVRRTKFVLWNNGNEKELEFDLKALLTQLPRP